MLRRSTRGLATMVALGLAVGPLGPTKAHAAEPGGVAADERAPAASTESKGKLTWGLDRPTPRWKWIGFGVSAGLFTIGLGTTIGTQAWLTSSTGGFRKKLVEAAEASLNDTSETNDVDPNLPQGLSLCTYARSRPTDENGVPIGEPSQVRNSSVVQVCNQADDIDKVRIRAAIVTGVAAASTLAFTLLIFVHRKPVTRSTAWRRHSMHLSTVPRPDGLALHLGGRF